MRARVVIAFVLSGAGGCALVSGLDQIGTGGSDGGSDGGSAMEGSTPKDGGSEGGNDAGVTGVPCGSGSCIPDQQVCCIDAGATSGSCTTSAQCGASSIRCHSAADCDQGETCCLSQLDAGTWRASCVNSCAATVLCDTTCLSGQCKANPTFPLLKSCQ